jgi:hypothetical protein
MELETIRAFASAALSNRIVAGAVSGALSAAAADYGAFRSWKSVQEALAYSWGVAIWRWFQGAVIGAVGALGLAPFQDGTS